MGLCTPLSLAPLLWTTGTECCLQLAKNALKCAGFSAELQQFSGALPATVFLEEIQHLFQKLSPYPHSETPSLASGVNDKVK